MFIPQMHPALALQSLPGGIPNATDVWPPFNPGGMPWGGGNPWGGGGGGGHQDSRPNINWGEVLKAGASADYFGHADYSEALSRGATRQQILAYLDANPGKLRGSNPKGKGGLYDQIAKEGADAIGTHYGDYTLEGRKDYFGAADYAGSRAAGATDLQIKNWLAQNPGTLRGGNTYESLKSDYGSGFWGSGTTGTGAQATGWKPFDQGQMDQWQQSWQQSMDDYNKSMQDWQDRMQAKQDEVTYKGSKAVEGGAVSSVAQAGGTYAGGGRGTANWRRANTRTAGPMEMIGRAISNSEQAKMGLNIA